MRDPYTWPDQKIYSTFIIGGQYKTVLSYYYSFNHVIQNLLDEFFEGDPTKAKPIVVINAGIVSPNDAEYLVANDLPDLVLE